MRERKRADLGHPGVLPLKWWNLPLSGMSLEEVLLRLVRRSQTAPLQPNLQLAVAPEDHQPTAAFRSPSFQIER